MQRFCPTTIWIALGVIYFGSLIWAVQFFPHPYNWLHTVISSLASPRDNPHAYWIACTGLATSGLLLIPLAFRMQKRLEPYAPQLSTWAGRLFLLGALSLTLSALIVPGHYRILGIGRSHEHLAQISGVAFCLSLLLYLKPILALPRPFWWLRVSALILVALPVGALLLSRISLFLAYEFFSSTNYQAVKSSLWNSLALWEWIGSVCIYLFLGLVALGLLPRSSALRSST